MARYSEELFRGSTSQLVKPKIGQPLDDLIDRVAETQTNPPVIDRRLRELPPPAFELIRLVGLSRFPLWKVGHLITLSAAIGHAEGFAPVEELLKAALAFPAEASEERIDDFVSWLGRLGTFTAPVFIHPAVLTRARGLTTPVPPSKSRLVGITTDGLEWPLRIAAAWQATRGASIKLTQARSLFKRDLAKLQSDELLNSPFVDLSESVVDSGVLAFEWAVTAELFRNGSSEYHAEAIIPGWNDGLWPTLTRLYTRFFAIESWDPRKGYTPSDETPSPTPTAVLLIFDQFARQPQSMKTSADLAKFLWENHPSWPSVLSREDAKTLGEPWVEAFLQSIAFPLRLVEVIAGEPRRYRLTDFGRHLLCGDAEPAAPPVFPQTLTVQPNAEMIVYRQGLTPHLIAELTRFAVWKQFGPACTLELTAEETYRGLESGMSLAVIKQTLDRHALRPLPANIADLLRRWADKRERITVYPSATLVEFMNPAELDQALSRGIVSIKLTDRIGLTADGRDPEFKALRLIGNREYDARPVQCVSIAPDGLTMSVDASQADLLLDAEITRIAEPVASNGSMQRQFRMSPSSLRAAHSRGMSLELLDRWLLTRTGAPLSPAGRLFLTFSITPPATAKNCRIVQFPSEELTDGLLQWPESAALIAERLGPKAVIVEESRLSALQGIFASLGLELQIVNRENAG